MGGRRVVLLVVAALMAAAATTVGGAAVNIATADSPVPYPAAFMQSHLWWWIAGSVVAMAGAGLLMWWSQHIYGRSLVTLVPVAQRPQVWVVDRPVQVDRIVAALRRKDDGVSVGITTAVHGAGGFGKTTVARLVRADRRVLRRFGGRVYWVTLGRDIRRGALVEKVNDLVRQIDPGRAQPFTDVRQAAEHLAAVLGAGPRRLLVVDDVWFDDQLEAFPVAGRCARLVTTRKSSLVAGTAISVRVDQMSQEQARRVLTADLPQLPPAIVGDLLQETGRWPLLLRLVNRILHNLSLTDPDITGRALDLLALLRRDKLTVDDLSGASGQDLDVNDPDQRDKAVAATIEASTGLLSEGEFDRFAELAIFVADEAIPTRLVTSLWQAIAGISQVAAGGLCARLADLALLSLAPTSTDGSVGTVATIGLHNVIRDYLHQRLGAEKIAAVHGVFLDVVAKDLRREPAVFDDHSEVTAWWRLADQARYLREHLIEHLIAARRYTQAEHVACDLRWVHTRLEEEGGPLGPFTDLSQIRTPRGVRLTRLFSQITHLLTPTDPWHSRLDILHDRVAGDPDWQPQARALASARATPQLTSPWLLPDAASPALQRTLTSRTATVQSLAVAPDGTWLATGGDDGLVRIWDVHTGKLRAVLTGHTDLAESVAISPDGSWLTSVGGDGLVRIWDVHTGKLRAVLTGHIGAVRSVAVAPDGSWLATGGDDGLVRIWDPTPRVQDQQVDHRPVQAVAVAPDGTWLATGGDDGLVRIWDADTGKLRAALTGHSGLVHAMAVAPDGSWLASGSDDRSVRIWDVHTGKLRAVLTGHTDWVLSVAVAPDGSWLASAGDDRSVRIWDVDTGGLRAVLTGHSGAVLSVAVAPDGTWLASAGNDAEVRIWDADTGKLRAALTGHSGWVRSVAVAPDGSWLASAGDDGSVRIWDANTRKLRATLIGVTGWVLSVAVAPDGSWLASGSDDGSVRIWDAGTGGLRATLTGHSGAVRSVAVAPDSAWLASIGEDAIVRIWDPANGRVNAMTRLEAAGHTSMWNPTGRQIFVGGARGLYCFTHLP